jgi:hypothetical protein
MFVFSVEAATRNPQLELVNARRSQVWFGNAPQTPQYTVSAAILRALHGIVTFNPFAFLAVTYTPHNRFAESHQHNFSGKKVFIHSRHDGLVLAPLAPQLSRLNAAPER